MSKIVVPAIVATLATGLCAQSKVVYPSTAARVSGNAGLTFPFTVSSTSPYRRTRYQEIVDLPAGAKGKLSALAFRLAQDHRTLPQLPAFSATLEVRVSTAQTTAATIHDKWVYNEGKDVTVVVARRTIQFPQVQVNATGPQPFAFKIPFDANKTLLFAGGKSLCIDMIQDDNDLYDAKAKVYNNVYMDAVDFSSGIGVTSHEGLPCFSSNPLTFFPFHGFTSVNLATGTAPNAGNLFAYANSYNGPPNGVGAHILCAGKLPVGLPIAGGCSLYVDLAKVVTIQIEVANSKGDARYPAYITGQSTYLFDTPFRSVFAGKTLHAQAFALDFKANQAGLVSTQLNNIEMPAYYKPQSYTSSYSYLTNYTSGTSGNRTRGRGHVLELTFN